MPFIDLDTFTDHPLKDRHFDITIIGAGAAGILLAVNLHKKGKNVLLIESGHFTVDPEKQRLNEVVQSGKILGAAAGGRNRAIGGTTLTWGGQSLHFSPLDFSRRDWVNNSGWPVQYETLAPYYGNANAFMKVDTLDYHDDIFNRVKLKDNEVDHAVFDFHVAKWANEPNFQVLYREYLDKHITVVYNAHLYKINRGEEGRVSCIEVKNFSLHSFSFKIDQLILSCGGIETNRIMLLNNIGNHSGWLGKCFMDHPCIEIGEVVTHNPFKLQRTFNTHIWKGRKYSMRLSLSRQFQEENKLLNGSASVMFKSKEDEFDPYAELRYFRKEFKFSSLVKLSGSIGDLLKTSWALFSKHFFYKVNADTRMVLMMEQEPIPESHIRLNNEPDKFGLPKAEIAWEISHKTWSTVIAMAEALKKEIARLNYGQLVLHENITAGNKNWSEYLTDVNHHMGGCRMSDHPDKGVVNSDLQVWHVPNMYVCSAAVYPTSSHSNPTLTLLALGLRLTEHLCNSNSQ